MIISEPGTTLENLVIDGAGQPFGYGILVCAHDVSLRKIKITNWNGIGIGVVGDGRNTAISDVEIVNPGWQGILFQNSGDDYSGSYVRNSRVTGAGLDSIQVGGKGAITVENNYIADGLFAGVYAMRGSRNCAILRNTVERCYGGIDISWGDTGTGPDGSMTGPDKSEGMIVAGNTIRKCCGGIGTASNGTVISNNIVSDTGTGFVQTYSLLGVKPTVASAGSGYKVGDIVTFQGGVLEPRAAPAQLQVLSVDANGGILTSRVFYLSVYRSPPSLSNQIQVTGGSGNGATFTVPKWNPRGFWREGIGILDAKNCVVTNNSSRGGQVGMVLSRVHQSPTNAVITDNDFRSNALYPIASRFAGRYSTLLGASNYSARNL